MSGKKILLMVLLVSVIIASAILGICWNLRHYVLVDFRFYPKNVQQMDLRDREISVDHYEKLQKKLPECKILWNVPFQGGSISSDAQEITVSTLYREDLRILECFGQLKAVKAENCTDYDNLLELWHQRPDLNLEYTVLLGTEAYTPDTEKVTLETVTEEEIALLTYLPNLKRVLCSGGEAEAVYGLNDYCRDRQLELQLLLGDRPISLDMETVTAQGVTEQQIGLLQILPELKQLYIWQPEASPEKLLELQKNRPDVTVTWEQTVCGQSFASDMEELDLSGVSISDLEAMQQELDYFPNIKLVFLGECGIDNEALAEYRDQVRDRYKVVWTVSCGSKLKVRTDATTFMPVREYVYYFNDEEAYNLRYCEEMVCIDIGHMSIHNIDFVKYMPNLEYLILAHTQLQYIEPIRTCKKLKFLELDWAPVKDLSPLTGCTALEDLNLGMIYADFAPIEEMTWLKNLWMVECSSADRYRMPQALPDTRVMVTGAATVANGWRDLDNYYAMRDLLGMKYMSW